MYKTEKKRQKLLKIDQNGSKSLKMGKIDTFLTLYTPKRVKISNPIKEIYPKVKYSLRWLHHEKIASKSDTVFETSRVICYVNFQN